MKIESKYKVIIPTLNGKKINVKIGEGNYPDEIQDNSLFKHLVKHGAIKVLMEVKEKKEEIKKETKVEVKKENKKEENKEVKEEVNTHVNPLIPKED